MNRIGKYFAMSIALMLVLLSSGILQADVLQTTKGTLTPPSDEEWQQMLEHRTERHGCMAKTEKALNTYKTQLFDAYPQPTTNQLKVDILYYKIDLTLNFSSNTIDGYVESKMQALYDGVNTIDFNLTTYYGGLNVYSVYINGSPADSYTHTGDLLTVYMGQTFDTGAEFTVTVNYGGYPGFDGSDGMLFYYWGSTQVEYTNCEPWGARLWWPCKDHPYDKPDSMDIIVTHPSTMKAVSNGTMVSSVNNGDGTKTSHWHEGHPIATYLVQLACTNYTLYTDSWQYEAGQYMPIQNYSYPGISSGSMYYSLYYMINYIKPSLEALSYYFTLYPFVDEKYGHNHYGWGGAMEHQTLTSISPNFNSEYVIAHELGHQWAGDKVTCANFHHMWLNEGFASYSEPLYFLYHYGESYYRSWLESQKHLDAGTPYVEDIINDDMFDNTTVYDKGSWVAYMLHMVLGDSMFFDAMDNYFNNPALAWGAAYTDDLRLACEQVYGSDLSWFFNEWVYQPGNPDYVYSYMYEEDAINGGYDMYILLRQEQEWGLFKMPVDMHVFAGAYDTAFTVFNSQRGQVWQIDIPNPPDSMWVDRDEKILRTVAYDPEFRMSILAQNEVDTAYIGVPYYAEYSVVAGTPDYNWRKISGQFPYGMIFHNENTAYIEGVPNWTSDFVFTLEVTDSDVPQNADTITLKIVVLPSEAPDIPQLLLPESGTTTSSAQPQFVWSSTAGAGGNYTFECARDLSFTSSVTTVSELSDTTYTPALPLADGLWFWHVSAVNSEGTASQYQQTPFLLTVESSQGMRGDCNDDGTVNVSDAVYIINYIFAGGPAPDPLLSGDPNCDNDVNISDAVYIINYIFVGGDPPCDW
jgi:aminopeptidase N